jgi:hypothetical protein
VMRPMETREGSSVGKYQLYASLVVR